MASHRKDPNDASGAVNIGSRGLILEEGCPETWGYHSCLDII